LYIVYDRAFMCMLFIVGKCTFTAYEDSEMPYLL